MKRLFATLPLLALGIVFGGGAAFAATWQKTTDGSSVIFNNNVLSNDERFHVCDTESDGHAVYVEFVYNGGSETKHYWSGGNGTCGNFLHTWAENNVVKFRSCEVINEWPNDCSSYEDGARS